MLLERLINRHSTDLENFTQVLPQCPICMAGLLQNSTASHCDAECSAEWPSKFITNAGDKRCKLREAVLSSTPDQGHASKLHPHSTELSFQLGAFLKDPPSWAHLTWQAHESHRVNKQPRAPTWHIQEKTQFYCEVQLCKGQVYSPFCSNHFSYEVIASCYMPNV